MAESAEHIALVQLLEKWICINLLNYDNGAIRIDSPNACGKATPPPVINQYRPDIYVDYKGVLIIGEAKTERDLDCSHSKRQFESYLMTCEMYEGKSYLIVAVSNFVEASARNMLKSIRKRLNVMKTEHHVISPLTEKEVVICNAENKTY